MKSLLIITLSVVCILFLVYFAGPTFPKPKLCNKLPNIRLQTSEFESYIKSKEAGLKIKPDNQSKLVWANDSLKNKTEYCLLYLHGFSACWYEGSPININFAQRYGMNLYAPLLASHGIDTTEPLLDMTPDRLYESAKEALVAAHCLGEKVIIMATSTGATLGLKMATEFPDLIDGFIFFSPNVALKDPTARMTSKPWGLQIARFFMKGKYRVRNSDFGSEDCHYFNCKYRLEAIVYLQQLLDATMKKETFAKVDKPLFMGYYYKDEENQDQTVSVAALLKMYEQLGTPENLKQKVAFPEADDHVIGCQLFSKQWQDVEKATYQFAEEKLGLTAIK